MVGRELDGGLGVFMALAVSVLVIGAAPLIGPTHNASAPKPKAVAPLVTLFDATPATFPGAGGTVILKDTVSGATSCVACSRDAAGDRGMCQWFDVGGQAGQCGEEAQALLIHLGAHRVEEGEGQGQGDRCRSSRTFGVLFHGNAVAIPSTGGTLNLSANVCRCEQLHSIGKARPRRPALNRVVCIFQANGVSIDASSDLACGLIVWLLPYYGCAWKHLRRIAHAPVTSDST